MDMYTGLGDKKDTEFWWEIIIEFGEVEDGGNGRILLKWI
jgi:hypothetical protein